MIRNNHAREGGCDGDKEAKRGKTGRLVKSDRIYCLHQQISGQKLPRNAKKLSLKCTTCRSFLQINLGTAYFTTYGEFK